MKWQSEIANKKQLISGSVAFASSVTQKRYAALRRRYSLSDTEQRALSERIAAVESQSSYHRNFVRV